MKALFSALALAIVFVGCDGSNPSDQSEQADLFSEESMLMYATAADDDPALNSPNATMHNGPRHGRMLHHLTTYLELTEEQQTAVRLLGEAMFEELTAIREQVQSGDLSREDARPLIHDLRTQFMDDVKALLTDEQLAKLEEWQQKRWKRRHHRHGGFGGQHQGG